MKKRVLTKLTASILALSFAIPTAFAVYPVPRVEAQAQGKASACLVGLMTALGMSVPAYVKEFLGVPDGSGNTATHTNTNASTNAVSFNSCVLQPLAKIMIVAIIRNIGASIVNWVNSGFEGKPLFVTDFGGTLLDAADQAAGTFIEGTELGFLCQDLSLQIRIALALKYSSSFRQRATCTLSDIGQNIQSFADNNGGVGWDNWLQLTTEPQNNIYGAYAMSESELTERMARAVNVKEKRITLAQGFLDFETCDEYETPQEVKARIESGGVIQPQASGSGVLTNSNNQLPGSSFGSFTDYTTSQAKKPGSGILKNTGPATPSASQQFADSINSKPKCKPGKMTTKTPGTFIAGKLNNEFLKGDIQQAVAQEIDDVIAATMNQLTQKVISGAQGLLGLSKKSSYSSQNYYNKYQNQYYGTQVTTSVDIGATTPLEDYTISDYDSAAQLINSNSQVQDINNATNKSANQAIKDNQARQAEIDAATGSDSTQSNAALFKPASQSSSGAGLPAKAVDGVKDGNASQYNQPASTGEEQNPWWEVDLGSAKDIKELRIWRVMNKPISQTLEVIRAVAKDDSGKTVWTSDYIGPTESSPNPLAISVNKNARYIRIEKKGSLDEQCHIAEGYREETVYESCYHPLELAEVEVMAPSPLSNMASSTLSVSSGGSSSSSAADDSVSATSTVSLIVVSPAKTVTESAPLSYELAITAKKPVSNLRIGSSLSKNDVSVPFLSVFSSASFAYGAQGQTATYSIDSDSIGTVLLGRISVPAEGKYTFRASGIKSPYAAVGSYTLDTIVTDDAGTILDEQIEEFIVQ